MCLVNAPEDVKKSSGRETEWVARQSQNFWILLVSSFLSVSMLVIITVVGVGVSLFLSVLWKSPC